MKKVKLNIRVVCTKCHNSYEDKMQIIKDDSYVNEDGPAFKDEIMLVGKYKRKCNCGKKLKVEALSFRNKSLNHIYNEYSEENCVVVSILEKQVVDKEWIQCITKSKI